MAPEQRRLLSVRRGLCGAAVAALAAGVLAFAMPLGFLATGRAIPGATARDLGYDLREEPEQLASPAVGCAAMCACAGWATFAPAGRHRFAWSLATVFLASAAAWLVIGALGLAPRHYKGLTDGEWYARLAVFVVGPAVVAAACLTVVRVRRARQRPNHPLQQTGAA